MQSGKGVGAGWAGLRRSHATSIPSCSAVLTVGVTSQAWAGEEEAPERSCCGVSMKKGAHKKKKKSGERLCTRANSDRMRAKSFKLKRCGFRLDVKKFVTIRVVRCWNRLPGEVVDAPSWKVLKAGLDRALSNLI